MLIYERGFAMNLFEPDYKQMYESYKKMPSTISIVIFAIGVIFGIVDAAVFGSRGSYFNPSTYGLFGLPSPILCVLIWGAVGALLAWFIGSLVAFSIAPVIIQTETLLSIDRKVATGNDAYSSSVATSVVSAPRTSTSVNANNTTQPQATRVLKFPSNLETIHQDSINEVTKEFLLKTYSQHVASFEIIGCSMRESSLVLKGEITLDNGTIVSTTFFYKIDNIDGNKALTIAKAMAVQVGKQAMQMVTSRVGVATRSTLKQQQMNAAMKTVEYGIGFVGALATQNYAAAAMVVVSAGFEIVNNVMDYNYNTGIERQTLSINHNRASISRSR